MASAVRPVFCQLSSKKPVVQRAEPAGPVQVQKQMVSDSSALSTESGKIVLQPRLCTLRSTFDGNIVGYDVHYNVAIINILSNVPLPIVTLRLLDDSISIDRAIVNSTRDNFHPRPLSSAFKLCAEEVVVALGRNCRNFDMKPGVERPLVNSFREMIGVNFMNEHSTPFLLVNIVDKWLNHFKKYEKFCRP
ncbi:hypothetical protein LguiA_013579 [Lonicera macranthoides]